MKSHHRLMPSQQNPGYAMPLRRFRWLQRLVDEGLIEKNSRPLAKTYSFLSISDVF